MRRGSVVALCLAMAPAVMACESSGFSYVGNDQDKTYFRIPEGWQLFDENDLLGNDRQITVQSLQGVSGQWMVAFDSSPDPSVDNVLDTSSEHPSGYAQVRPLSEQEHESYSLASLRNAVIPIDQLSQDEGMVKPVSEEEILLEDGIHGSRLVNEVKIGEELFTIDQTALLDAATRKLYVLVIGCQKECYEANQKTIEGVADSWTVQGG